jgi:hypothetical protein
MAGSLSIWEYFQQNKSFDTEKKWLILDWDANNSGIFRRISVLQENIEAMWP